MDVFTEIEEAMAGLGPDAFAVHQGKLYRNPDLLQMTRTLERLLIAPEKHSRKGGEIPLRAALSKAFLGAEAARDSIALCNGGTNGLSVALCPLLTPERRIVHVLTPFWMYLPGVITHAGGTLHEIPTLADGRLIPEVQLLAALRNSLAPESGCVYVATPANPVGNRLTPAFLAALTNLCEERDLHLVVDHAYCGFTEDARPDGVIAELPPELRHPRIVNVFTFSKLYGVPGLRLGFVCASPDVTRTIAEHYRYTNYTPNSFSQSIVYHLLHQGELLAERRRMYLENLAVIRRDLGDRCLLPEGGFFAFLHLADERGRQALLDRGVGVVDGRLFGSGYESYARLCFTAENAQRLAACCALVAPHIATHQHGKASS